MGCACNEGYQEEQEMTDAATKAKKVKQMNFTTHEDVLLCKAYVNISTNPVAGNGKKSKDFWNGIKEKFDELCKAEPRPKMKELLKETRRLS
jgi:hypothetical protein